MKTFIFSIVVVFLLTGYAYAQTSVMAKQDTLTKVPKAVFFEILGPGALYSFNFDTRFSKKAEGLGIRTGFSYTQISDVSLFTLPVQLNYLLGKNEKYFEMGLGATYATAAIDVFEEGEESGSTVIGTMTFGYRKQPIDGGFMFRGGVSPVFGRGYFLPYYPYLSFGYSF